MDRWGFALALFSFALGMNPASGWSGKRAKGMIFATFAEDADQLREACVLVESLRSFGDTFREAPFWVYYEEGAFQPEPDLLAALSRLKAEARKSRAPADALKHFYGAKAFGAAKAEAAARGKGALLVWLDCDTVIWREPGAFLLPQGKSLGYKPVMLLNIASPYAEPPDEFWSRLYKILQVPEEAIFPMNTTVDKKEVRAYFNAGVLVVRPEKGILGKWPKAFEALYRDSVVAGMCRTDRKKFIFLHQAALAGAILTAARREDMVELPKFYNYSLPQHGRTAPEDRPVNVDEVVTLRYDDISWLPEAYKQCPEPSRLLNWLKQKFPAQP